MKFGLYLIPTTNLEIRCIDGRFEYIHPSSYSNCPAGHPDRWRAVLDAPGTVAPQRDVLAKLAACGRLATWSRAIARLFYGVPDDVELYQYGDFGVNP